MADLFDESMTFHFPGAPGPMNVEQFTGPAKGIYGGFNDFKHSVEELIEEGDLIACRVNITGTHTGDFQGIPATHQPIAVSASKPSPRD